MAAKIDVQTHKVADLDARVSQIDAAIAEATRRGRTTGAMSIMEASRPQLDAARDKTRNEVLSLLTPEQREKFLELEKAHRPMEPPPFGGPPGPPPDDLVRSGAGSSVQSCRR